MLPAQDSDNAADVLAFVLCPASAFTVSGPDEAAAAGEVLRAMKVAAARRFRARRAAWVRQ